MQELPDPIITNATLDKVTMKRGKAGAEPEYTVALTGYFEPEDLIHLEGLQRRGLIQVAFAPAGPGGARA